MKKAALYILIVGWSTILVAQRNVIAAAGEISQTNKISLEWTVGEVAVTTISLPTGSQLTQGFHQPEILLVESPPVDFQGAYSALFTEAITLAPNPVSTSLTIQIPESWSLFAYTVELFDLNGRLLQTDQIESGLVTVQQDMSLFPASTYWLRIKTKETGQVQTFKVVKI